jgi:glutamyl-tRNA synthetase
MSSIRVRFAPSPTGLLHIGGARTALFNWLYARHHKGTFILRVEDTDAARNTKEAFDLLLSGLLWLGVDWDEGPMPDGTQKGDYGPYLQSQRGAIYEKYLKQLLDSRKAYESDGAIKFRIPKTPILVPDQICGDITLDRATEPDLVIRRKDGSFIFHFVNVIDDLEMKVTHVIRAYEHLSNTPKHMELFNALGAKPPLYAHIPLILNNDGSKMSKRDKGAAVSDYIEGGYLPQAVRNYLCLLGWSPKDNTEIFPIEYAIEKFDLAGVNRSNAHFDLNKLYWMNGEYMAKISVEELEPLAITILTKANVLPEKYDQNYFRAALAIVKEKIKLAGELPEWMDYFFKDDFGYDPEAAARIFTAEGLNNLEKLQGTLEKTAAWDFSSLEKEFKALAAATGQKTGSYIHTARLAVSGKPVGPSLYHLLEVLGRDRVLKRVKRALDTQRK